MTSSEEQQLEELYGPLARGEYRRGDRVRYRRGGQSEICTGVILWITGPHEVLLRNGRYAQAPTSYIVEPDQGGLPDVIYEPDIMVS